MLSHVYKQGRICPLRVCGKPYRSPERTTPSGASLRSGWPTSSETNQLPKLSGSELTPGVDQGRVALVTVISMIFIGPSIKKNS